VSEITPKQSMAQLEESVARLAAPDAEQRLWAEEHDYPIRELILDLDLAWPLWQPRLSEAGIVDADDEAALDLLRNYAISLVDPKYEHLFTWNAVRDAPEWRRVRESATNALEMLRRPQSQKMTHA
jgi:hypothetical protein